MQVTGIFLYSYKAVYGKMLTELSDIDSEQSAPTKRRIKK